VLSISTVEGKAEEVCCQECDIGRQSRHDHCLREAGSIRTRSVCLHVLDATALNLITGIPDDVTVFLGSCQFLHIFAERLHSEMNHLVPLVETAPLTRTTELAISEWQGLVRRRKRSKKREGKREGGRRGGERGGRERGDKGE